MRWDGKRSLVTGGAGFIGMNLIRELCAANSYVTVMDDFSAAPRSNLSGLPVDIVEKSVMEESSFANLSEIDYVFHLASPSSEILKGERSQEDSLSFKRQRLWSSKPAAERDDDSETHESVRGREAGVRADDGWDRGATADNHVENICGIWSWRGSQG